MFRKFLAASSALVLMACMGTTAHAQVNDDCDGAIDVGALPTTIDGDTLSATDDMPPACAMDVPVAAGVWYTFVGTGFQTEVSVCSAGGTADYDSQIAVYSGGCADLFCISGNNDGSSCLGTGNEGASSLVFCAAPGVTYHVLVAGNGGQTGTFTLAVDDTFGSAPCSTTCASPTVIGADEMSSGDTEYLTAQGEVDPNHDGPGPDCLDFRLDNNGNKVCTAVVGGLNDWWFEFQGTGEEVEFEVIMTGASWDPDMSIYCGSQGCDELECVAADGGTDPVRRTTEPLITLCTDIDTLYYIQVTGNTTARRDSDKQGSFDLFTTTLNPGTLCSDAATCGVIEPPEEDCCEDCELLSLLDPVLPGGVPSSHPCMMELPEDPANPTTAPVFALPGSDAVPGDECCTTFETIRLALPGPPSVPSSHPCFVPAEPEAPGSAASPTSDVSTSAFNGGLQDDTDAGGIDLLAPGTGRNDDASRTGARTRRYR